MLHLEELRKRHSKNSLTTDQKAKYVCSMLLVHISSIQPYILLQQTLYTNYTSTFLVEAVAI